MSAENNTNTQNNTETNGTQQNPPADNNSNSPAQNQKPAEKTFNQNEVDEIVKQRFERAKKDMPSKEELAAFKKWQDEQKTNEQKSQEAINAANKAKEEAEQEKKSYEAKVDCLSKGVKTEYVDDVIALALRLVDDNTTIGKAIDSVIAKYPVFADNTNGEQVAPGITTGKKTGINNDGSENNPGSFISVVRENQVKRK